MLLKDAAYQKIKEKILEEEYPPGEFLSERTLINDLQMSKTPIKNALTRLEAEGFASVSSKQGILVHDLSVERINNIYNLRIALETFNCEEMYRRIAGDHLKELEKNLEETRKTAENLDVKTFANLDHEFHLALSEIAGNSEITRILINYQDQLLRITLRHLKKDPMRIRKFYEDHVQLYEALKNNEAESVEIMRKHLQESKQMLFK
ncbi:GntR family transcriptional regulator [Salibacterium qingdaonense]|uniref:Transcriptional regulator, GntR family n=1 Tax=Salibacterium qingdaonense TaxID=266892 RepID=A0A1I4PLM1_9BACI|nr:GntR family transcriptional regulator [Salibacterium qingdaonense]SFM28445.1 transcriptional regulator, GntR family [Salibacterium qingdaonense]